jgi:hypothetical protein
MSDAAAFTLLLQEHYDDLTRFVRRRADPPEVEDIVGVPVRICTVPPGQWRPDRVPLHLDRRADAGDRSRAAGITSFGRR